MPDVGIVDMGYHVPYIPWIDSITRDGDDIIIHWNAKDGVSYFVEFSTDLSIWHAVDVGQANEWTHSGGASYPQMYYRVREQ